jgi:mono/diheme cytochrome c family protein
MRITFDISSVSAAVIVLLSAAFAPLAAQSDSSPSHNRPSAPTDTLDAVAYQGWKQFRLLCDRCHGEEARGTTFGPDLLPSFKADGIAASAESFRAFMATGRPEKGMPPAAQLGLSPEHFDGVFRYLQGRGTGRFKGGRPAQATS